MADITLCNNYDCPVKVRKNCLRATAIANLESQSFHEFVYDKKKGCDFFIEKGEPKTDPEELN